MAAGTAYFILAVMEDTARSRELCSLLERDFHMERVGTEESGKASGEKRPDLILALSPPASLKRWLFHTAEKNDIPILILSGGPLPTGEETAGGLIQYVREDIALRELETKITLAINHAAVFRNLKTVRERTGAVSRPTEGKPEGKLIAIGASMGGVEALSRILTELPPEMPGIVVVQHMPKGFTEMYAKRLDQDCRLRVVQAENHQKVEAGTVYIAPGDFQMEIVRLPDKSYQTHISEGERVSGHKPSVNVLFRSVAKCAGNRALGVILTGMGDDGADGLLAMRRAGANTVGQDAGTSIVYGMPRVAFERGAVCRQLPLMEIPRCLMEYAHS